jgi:hypothetical protein
VRARNAAKLCHAEVIPMGTAKAPTAKVRGAAPDEREERHTHWYGSMRSGL